MSINIFKMAINILCVCVFCYSCGDAPPAQIDSTQDLIIGFELFFEEFSEKGKPCENIQGETIPDDYSQEHLGYCVIDGRRYHYRYEVINRRLASDPVARDLLGADHVETCAMAERAIATKMYLSSLTPIDAPDIGDIPPGQETPPAEDKQDSEVVPYIWKGNSTTASNNQDIVHINLPADGNCTGMVINSMWILTSAHCIDDSISGDAGTCSGCLKAYWWDPSSGNKECITDSSLNHSSCESYKTVWLRYYEDWEGTPDATNDIGLIYYSSGWNENISEARLYNGMPSPLWSGLYDFGRGYFDMCDNDGYGVKRRGIFDYPTVYTDYSVVNADDDYRNCYGDSGGPLSKWSGNFYLHFGINHSIETSTCDGGGESKCAAPSSAYQWQTRIDRKIQWIRDYTDLNCDETTDNNYPFVRCDD